MRSNTTQALNRIVKFYILSLALILCCTDVGAQITVTATAGTTGPTVYTTLAAAINAVSAGTHQGAVNISVTAGTTEVTTGQLNRSGTGAANYTSVLIKPATGVTATIASNLGNSGPILLNGCTNVTIDGSNTPGGTTRNLTINNLSNTQGDVIRMATPGGNGCAGITIKNCNIVGLGGTTGLGFNTGVGIISGGNGMFSQSTGTNTDIVIENNSISGWIQGGIIAIGPTFRDANWTIRNNTMNDCGFQGILIYYTQNLVINDNTISNNNLNTATGNPMAGIFFSWEILNAEIYNNKIFTVTNNATNGAYGIYFDLSLGSNINVYNNFIANMVSGSTNNIASAYRNGHGIYMDAGGGVNIYHNSINQNTNQTGGGAHYTSALCFDPFAVGRILNNSVNVVDNILVNNETVGTANYGIISTAPNSIFTTINYNDYYASSGNLGYIGGARTSIAAIQTGFGGNGNSITAPPSWLSMIDLHLQPIAANLPLNAGTFIASPSITTDIDGNPRTAPTIGADELVLCITPVLTGPVSVCPGSTVTLSSNIAGGTWSSNNTPVATVVPGPSATTTVSGVPSATAGGSAVITYTTTAGCTETTTVTVIAAPPVITGNTTVCAGSTTQLSNAVAGTWTSSTSSVATITPNGGLVGGGSVGTSIITFTSQATGCTRTVQVTVAPIPNGITGTPTVCPGATTSLTSSVAGGTWSSATTTVGTVTPGPAGGGVVSGIIPGQTLITYTTLAGCTTTTLVTVNVPPPPIAGVTTICAGNTTMLTDLEIGGGTWTSVTTSVATVTPGPSANAVVTGVALGTSLIRFVSATSGCFTTTLVTVSSTPGAISGITSLCPGASTILSNSIAGGNWTSSNTSVGTVISGPSPTTTFFAVSGPGTTTVTYSLGGGCNSTILMTVNAAPPAIAGNKTVCVGSTTLLSNSITGGGNWTSVTTSVATITPGPSNGATVTGVSAGTSVISFTTGAGCITTTTVTVIDVPGPISGFSTVCTGAGISLSNAIGGGTWTSSNTGVATATTGPSAGTTVTGAAQGNTVITYSNSCASPTVTITVFAPPAPIVGPLSVCSMFTHTLTNTSVGGGWSSNDLTVATVTPGPTGGGVYTGVNAGQAEIKYTTGCGVDQTVTVTVNTRPVNIYGSNTICLGANTTLSNDGSPVGTWTSSNTNVATVNPTTGQVFSSGVVGTTLITASNLCGGANMTLTVASPTAIAGITTFCQNSTTTLSNGVSGGIWTSSNTLVATVDPVTGDVKGVTLGGTGTSNITYTITGGCFTVTTVTTTIAPGPVNGLFGICQGTTTCLTNSVGGGVWSSSNTLIATVTPGGCMTGAGAGSANILYMVGTCPATAPVTVYALPGTITGPSSVCVNSTITLGNTTTPGQWSSSNTNSATIDPVSGVVTGIAPPGTIITYTTAFGCVGTKSITVNSLPGPISGNNTICAGTCTTLIDGTGPGTWTSSNPGVATVSSAMSASAILCTTPAASGTTSVVVTNPAGCRAGTLLTVNVLPSPITGSSAMCTGTTATLTAAPAGGTWNSSSPPTANINATTGVINAVFPGTTVITYSLSTTCSSTMTVTVNQMPPAITGNPSVCLGLTTTLSNTLSGGTWSSSNTNVAPVTTSAVVTGMNVGSADISYTRAGCAAVLTVTVNPLPAAITGPAAVCVGSNITLSDATPNGTWSSSNSLVATIDINSGIVGGVSAAIPNSTAVITYILPTGCTTQFTITVSPLPAPIAGPTQMCAGTTAVLSSGPMSGTWSTNNATIATVLAGPASTTIATAGSNPGGVFTPTFTTSAGCTASKNITINPIPAPILGTTLICLNSTTTLTDITSGGTWSSSNTSVATVIPAGNIIYGWGVGTSRISYILTSGCFATVSVTVNPLPTAIDGNPNVCVGSTTQLSNGTTGGLWTSSNTSVATINTTGVVFGVATGTSTIIYTLGSGCTQTITVTVNPLPAAITGTFALCNGSCTTLSDATPLGSWSAANTAVGTISASGGTFCGLSSGTSRVTYTINATGCFAVATMTVNPLPAAISGPNSVCEGSTINLSSTTSGVTWSSSNTSVATVTTIGTSVVVTGVTAGITDIIVINGFGCATIKTVTVNVQPAPILGAPVQICQGSCIQLNDVTPGGIWNSSNTTVATVDGTGLTCGSSITAGNANITYAIGTCRSIGIVTVKPQPGAITGVKTICQGATSTLSSTVGLGVWTSDNLPVATVNAATGTVYASIINTGTANITYTLNGCSAMTTVTVNVQPGPITGPSSVCNSNTISLTDPVGGGTWTSSNTSIATVEPTTGIVHGTGAGSITITHFVGTCFAVKAVTVNPQPSAIFGPAKVCNGSSIQLSNATGVGVWSSSNPSIATVNGTGLVTGLSVGTSVITVQIGICYSTTTITVNPLPSQITGIFYVCQNSQTTLADLTPGGTWSSSNTTIATINSGAGIVYGSVVGLTNITFTLTSTGCIATHTLQVIAAPQPIQGPSSICIGGCTQLSDVTNGGTWTSSNSNVVAVDQVSGLACGGIISGTAIISYTLGSGCRVITPLVVYPLTAITGATTLCEGQSVNLSNSTIGGSWSSNNTSVAVVNAATGVVTGTGGGSTAIFYTLSSGCVATTTVTVSPAPAPITGPSAVCVAQTIALSSTTASGIWSSSNVFIADVDPFGVVSGIAPGTAVISYTAGGCPRTFTVTVNAASAPITGNPNICLGNTSDLDDATPGGIWSSSNTAVATVDPATGLVFSVAVGTTTIEYTPASGCAASILVTVNSLPGIIVGPAEVCVGSTIALTNSVAGGAWFSSDYTTANVGFASGVVTGIVPGMVTISYQIFNGCIRSTTITVNPLPTISGPTQVCMGSSVTLSAAPSGGVWSSGASPVVNVNPTTGNVTGITPGTANITYTLPTTGCAAVITMSVNPLPAPITGNFRICKGGISQLASASAGGVWSSSNTFIGTVDPSTGLVYSDANPSSSIFSIIYTLPTGCAAVQTMTVVNAPSPISGPGQVCVGSAITLSDTTAGGVWTSFDITVATVTPATGIVTGVAQGFTIITYTMGGGACYQTHAVIVNPLPAPITGNTEVCLGLSTVLSDATPGGAWSSQNPSIASVTAFSGVVTGISAGNTTITYSLPTSCYVTTTFTTNPLPAPITGNTNICLGGTRTLSDSPGPGTWSVTNPAVATIDPLTGVITGVDFNVPPGSPYGVTTVTYTINATGCIQTTTVAVHPLPQVFTVTGGGSYCSGTGGVHVGLSGSEIGVSYYLYLGTATPTGPVAGTGGPLDFGLQISGGVYTVVANNTYTTCSSDMTGSATITILPAVTPTVSIIPNPSDTVCAGTPVTFVPMPANAGTSPVYTWRVNGVTLSVAASYTFVPANGDVVSVLLTSNAICAIPNTARDTVTMAVYTSGRPSVGMLVSPNDTVCSGTPVSFTAVPTNGGPSPLYWWMVNGFVVSSASVYTYTPSNGDIVQVGIKSNSPCRIGDSALSYVETISLVNPTIPVVTITSSPGTLIPGGTADTLTANVTGGIAPVTYQWYVNGAPITGATNETFVINNVNYGDSIGCLINNGGFCHEQSFGWTYIQVHSVGVSSPGSVNADLVVVPNPTNGAFFIKGSLGTTHDQTVNVELTDVLGQVVYKGTMIAKGGRLNNRIELQGTLANGMYMLNVRTESISKVFHLVVEQ